MLRQFRTGTRRQINSASLGQASFGQASNIHQPQHYPSPLQPTTSYYANLYSTPALFREDSKLQKLVQPKATKSASVTGDYRVLGTDSDEYFLVDTDPSSTTLPYEDPRTSGRQLRYGGRGYTAKDDMEAFSEMSKSNEGPDGTECWGRKPEKARG